MDRLLVIGDYLPEVSPTINLIRFCEQPEVNLPIGIYDMASDPDTGSLERELLELMRAEEDEK